MAAKFGTSGLRGLVEELDDGTAAAYTIAFLRHLKASGLIAEGDPVFVGQDLRPSSAEIAAQCMAAIEDEKLDPVDCGALPTPALAIHAMARKAASIMITGSHIPADRNGVKFYRPDGEIDKDDEAAMIASVGDVDKAALRWTPHHKPTDEEAQARANFVARYAGFLAEGCLVGRRIGIYEHSSVIRSVLSDILAPSGAEIIPVGHSETFIPVDTEAVSDQTRARIRVWVERYGLDALVSADGDGDRPLVADETGEVVRGDVLGLVVARLLEADSIVTPVTSNSGIEARVEAGVRRTKVGSPYVIADMAAAGDAGAERVIGFEANGGVLTGSKIAFGKAELSALPTRDSVLPIVSALAVSLGSGLTLSALVEGLALPVAASGRIENFATEKGKALVAILSSDEAERGDFLAPIGSAVFVDTKDGLRMTLADGRILHLRPSGNAPEMRIYSEAATEDDALALIEATRDRIMSS